MEKKVLQFNLGVCFEKRSRIAIGLELFFEMSFRPTCCPHGKRRNKHEIN